MALTLAQVLLGEMTESLSIARHKISAILVNKAPSAASYTKETIEGLLQHDLVGVVTPAPEQAFQSVEQGVPMVMLQSASSVAQQFHTIVERLAKV